MSQDYRARLTAARTSEAVMSGRDSPNGKLGLAQVILTGCLSIRNLKVRVHVGMRERNMTKEKPHRSGTVP